MKLQIPQPCSESWQDMTSTENGRSCAKCRKEVIDFTALSDTQLMDRILASDGKICGKLSDTQLKTNLLPTQEYSNRLSLPALVFAAVALTQNPAYSQQPDMSSIISVVSTADTIKKTPVEITVISLDKIPVQGAESHTIGDIHIDKKTLRRMRRERRRSQNTDQVNWVMKDGKLVVETR